MEIDQNPANGPRESLWRWPRKPDVFPSVQERTTDTARRLPEGILDHAELRRTVIAHPDEIEAVAVYPIALDARRGQPVRQRLPGEARP